MIAVLHTYTKCKNRPHKRSKEITQFLSAFSRVRWVLQNATSLCSVFIIKKLKKVGTYCTALKRYHLFIFLAP